MNAMHTPISDAMKRADHWNPDWDTPAQFDAAWVEKFMAMALHPLTPQNAEPPALDPKTYELIAIAVDASCTHLYAPGVRRHIRKALQLGVTPREILAVLQCVSVLGIHSMALGAAILQEELHPPADPAS